MAAIELFSVLITGANRGIGLEFTRQLLQLQKPPKYIFATYRTRDGIQALKTLRDTAPEGITVCLIKLDIQELKEIETAKSIIEDLVGENGLTLLINNAGVARMTHSFPEIPPEDLKDHFSVNAVGPFLVAQAMYPLLKKAAARQNTPGMSFSRAAILNMSSLAASIGNTGILFPPDLVFPSYKISKAALNMGMRILAAKMKEDNILVIMMCPGRVKTDMGKILGLIEPKESIETMLNTVSGLNENHHGTYMDRFGAPYPW